MTTQDLHFIESGVALEDMPSLEVPSHAYKGNLLDILIQLARRKWLIAGVMGNSMVIGVVLSFVLPVRYTSVTKIMPPEQTQSSASMLMNQLASGGAGSLAAMAGGGLGLKNPNDIYLGLLSSRPIADAIIQKFALVSVYGAKDMTAARKKLSKRTEIASEKTGFISVSVTDRDKQRAAQMANAYTNELRTLTRTLALTEASQRRLFYEEQLKQAKEALVSAELAFKQIQQSRGLVQLDAQAKAMIEGYAQLRAQVAAKQVDVQALRSYSTENNPDVQLAERELSSLQGEEERLEQSNHSAGITELGLADVPGAGLEYLRADHELRYRQALMDMLMKQYDAARLDEAKDAAIIQVVEPAIEPDRRSSPNRALIVAAFTAFGLLGGSMLALMLWVKEALQLDPVAAMQIEELKFALTGRKTAKA
jgi:uncharacterized protein involved in exopolysaccharide biosynthesis